MRVLVTGGAGYIGSHVVHQLLDEDYTVIVYDNLSHGYRKAVDKRAVFIEGDTGDLTFLKQCLREYNIEAVMHFAADIEVGESVTDPGKYYRNNFSNALVLLEALRQENINKFVFSSTAAVYGNPKTIPIQESDERSPINPYGRSKMMVEMALEDLIHSQPDFSVAILRYFNVAGAHPNGDMGEAHEPETHLIPRILQAALNKNASMKIFGTDYPTPDGTCVRDYVHVMDLAAAHILALKNLQTGKLRVFNLGSEKGFSVREVIRACEKVIGEKIPAEEFARRAGDPAFLVASSRKIREELGWKPQYPELETIVAHAWAWHKAHPKGYRSDNK